MVFNFDLPIPSKKTAYFGQGHECAFDEKTNTITLYSNKEKSQEKKIVLEFGKNSELLNKEQIVKELKGSK